MDSSRRRTGLDNWNRKRKRPKYPVLTTYCDLKTRVVVTVYDSMSVETRQYIREHPGVEYLAAGNGAHGNTATTAGKRAAVPRYE
jgi:hypothetical protein